GQLPVRARVGDQAAERGWIGGSRDCDEHGHRRLLGGPRSIARAGIEGAATLRGDPLEAKASRTNTAAQGLEALAPGIEAPQQERARVAGLDDRDDLEARPLRAVGLADR